MTNETTSIGSIHISPQAISTIAYQSALQSYGVVGLAPKNLINGIANILVNDPTHGIEVQYAEGHINIDLYIVIEYGTRIKSVATSVANTVGYHVEKALGVPINKIDVHVQGLRISKFEH
ncbi:MAG: Asp23/Gls24 family envelope stress response protein [Chloroflexota bacterium]|nr:Asp23/Gls24 family envelope stress response protein [Chloroflexota bacterium]